MGSIRAFYFFSVDNVCVSVSSFYGRRRSIPLTTRSRQIYPVDMW